MSYTSIIAVVSSTVVGLYIIATGIGNAYPNSKAGKACLRWALILGAVEKILPGPRQ